MAGKKAGRVERVSARNSDELGRLADSFNEMAISLEKPEKAKRQMIAKGFLLRGNQLRNFYLVKNPQQAGGYPAEDFYDLKSVLDQLMNQAIHNSATGLTRPFHEETA